MLSSLYLNLYNISIYMHENNYKKIAEIQEKKKKLKDRIQRINHNEESQVSIPNSEVSSLSIPTYEQKMTELLEKKKRIEQQKQREFRFKKMQDQYIERRKQAEREKRLEQIKNEKRIIQLEAGMKRMVFEGVKEKVKGANSQQLMVRAMLRNGEQGTKPRGYTSKGNVRRDFQKYLEAEQKRDIRQKWDIYELNEQRFEVFQKKQQAFMRQILLKQLMQQGKEDELDVMELSKNELENKIEEYGLNLEDYMINFTKQQIVQAVPEISKQSEYRIEKYKKEHDRQKQAQDQLERLKGKLKEELLLMPSDIVRMMRSLVFNIIDDTVFNFQKRINRFKMEEIPMAKEDLDQRYKNILLQSQDYQYSKQITLKLLERAHEQFFIEAAQEMAKLNNFAHDKTQQCFEWMFKAGTDIGKKYKEIGNINVPLNFEEEAETQPIQKPKKQLQKENYLSKFQDYTTNIFDVDKLTTEIINEINLLEMENQYFRNISIKIHNEKQAPDVPFHIHYERQLYVITNQGVFNSRHTKKLQPIGINQKLKILNWSKFHNFWLIHDNEKVSMYSAWGLEFLQNEIGQRMGILSGKITNYSIFPNYTFTGGICSLMIGFEKGQVLKYNFNLNRITNKQTNISIYSPLLGSVKSGNQPPFPANKKKTIPVENKRINANDEIHEFRQFFDHHTAAIIGIVFYKFNSFITIDKAMKCAIWYYDERQGAKCYKPAYQFEFVCSYFVYKEAENSRYRQVFPGKGLNETAEQLYDKWLKTEGFLKKQIYNNPKNKLAFYKTSDVIENNGEVPLWKINYDHSKERVLKINQSYYNAIQGKMQGKSAKLWRQYLLILCERNHPIRKDLETMKIYGWDIGQKRMRSIGIEFDVYQKQRNVQFEVLDNMLAGVDMHLLAVVSSGRILIFSLLSGQLVRNVTDAEYLENTKFANAYFTEITCNRSFLAAATRNFIAEISFNDRNNHSDQKQLNETMKQAQKKYINIL